MGPDDLMSTIRAVFLVAQNFDILFGCFFSFVESGGVIEDGDLTGQAGNLAQDPLFADAANGIYELTAGSPAINTGNNANCPATDLRGLSRPQNKTCEIGAFEIALVFIPIALK